VYTHEELPPGPSARTRYRYRFPALTPDVFTSASAAEYDPISVHDPDVVFVCRSRRTTSTGRAVDVRRVHETLIDPADCRTADTPVGDNAAKYGSAGNVTDAECDVDPDGMLPDKPDTLPEALIVRVDP